jgi:hypothetical protein
VAVAVAFEVEVAVVFEVAAGFEVALDFDVSPLGTLPLMRCRNRIRNETCLSAASSFRFPILALQQREAEGQRLAAAFLLLTFLWRSKEK